MYEVPDALLVYGREQRVFSRTFFTWAFGIRLSVFDSPPFPTAADLSHWPGDGDRQHSPAAAEATPDPHETQDAAGQGPGEDPAGPAA